MRPVEVQTIISAPREQVFDFVADLANHVAFKDHYLKEFRLARARSDGLGAAARYRVAAPFAARWAEGTIAECDRPRRIAEDGRMGRLGRSKWGAEWVFEVGSEGRTRVGLRTWSEPATLLDGLGEKFGGRSWLRRKNKQALERLRLVFEQPSGRPLARATVAGYEPGTAARYGA